MKKVVVLLLMFVAFQVSAQEFHFIPKIGLNLSNVSNTDGNMKPGMNVGIAGEFMLNSVFAVEPGINYSMQGTKYSESGITLKEKFDYLNIPVYAKAYLYNGLYAFAGPQFGFNIRAKESVSEDGDSVTEDVKDGIKAFDFAIGIGAGYQFDMGLMISANYNIGVTNIMKDSDGDSYRNGVFQLNLGWRF